MIAFIKGSVYALAVDGITLDLQGLGYFVHVAHPERFRVGETVFLHTYHHIREEEQSLYGFTQEADRDFFLQLINVKGVGAKTANQIMASASTATLTLAIEQGDVDRLKACPGIGAKTASQIVLDLKGKLVEVNKEIKTRSKPMSDTLEALKTLGYKPNELSQVEKVLRDVNDKNADELLKLALIELAKKA
jgi:Holliday junction DNA helicase RuvA